MTHVRITLLPNKVEEAPLALQMLDARQKEFLDDYVRRAETMLTALEHADVAPEFASRTELGYLKLGNRPIRHPNWFNPVIKGPTVPLHENGAVFHYFSALRVLLRDIRHQGAVTYVDDELLAAFWAPPVLRLNPRYAYTNMNWY
jgi:hypothetical protein